MKTSVFRTELPYSTESVWAVMTDTTQYAWRSDLKCIETDSDMVFVKSIRMVMKQYLQ